MGWFDVVRDWNLVKKQKAGFMEALRLTPPGAGISIKDPANPITARAIIEILREHPNEVEAMDYGFEVTLLRKMGMVQSMTADSYANLREKHQILTAESVAVLGLNGSDRLPARKYREGVPDSVNGESMDIGQAPTDIKLEKP